MKLICFDKSWIDCLQCALLRFGLSTCDVSGTQCYLSHFVTHAKPGNEAINQKIGKPHSLMQQTAKQSLMGGWSTVVSGVWDLVVWLVNLYVDWGWSDRAEFRVSWNALWAHVTAGNSYHFPAAPDSPLYSPNSRQNCLPLGLCKETGKKSTASMEACMCLLWQNVQFQESMVQKFKAIRWLGCAHMPQWMNRTITYYYRTPKIHYITRYDRLLIIIDPEHSSHPLQ